MLTDRGGVRLPQHFVLRNDEAMERAREVLPEEVGPQMMRMVWFVFVIAFMFPGWIPAFARMTNITYGTMGRDLRLSLLVI